MMALAARTYVRCNVPAVHDRQQVFGAGGAAPKRHRYVGAIAVRLCNQVLRL